VIRGPSNGPSNGPGCSNRGTAAASAKPLKANGQQLRCDAAPLAAKHLAEGWRWRGGPPQQAQAAPLGTSCFFSGA
jgi:hypothetical protein